MDSKTPSQNETDVPVEKLTVHQLRTKLKALNLPIYGCKRALYQRLTMSNSPRSQIPESISSLSQSAFPQFESSSPFSQSRRLTTSSGSSIGNLKLVELRERCKEQELPSAGRKQELVDRLEAHYEKKLLSDIFVPLDNYAPDHYQENLRTPAKKDILSHAHQSQELFVPVISRSHVNSGGGTEHAFDWEREQSSPSLPRVNDTDFLSFTQASQFQRLNLNMLKEICRTLKLQLSGKKKDIIERVMAHLSGVEESVLFERKSLTTLHHDGLHISDDFASFSSSKRMKKEDSDNYSLMLTPILRPIEPLNLMEAVCNISPEDLTLKTTRIRSNSKSSDIFIPNINDKLEVTLSETFYMYSSEFNERQAFYEFKIMCSDDGRVQTVRISTRPSCSCRVEEHNTLGNCKHILFVYLRVMKIPTDHPTISKTSLTLAETTTIFKNLKIMLKSRTFRPHMKKRIGTRSSSSNENEFDVVRENWADEICGVCFECFNSNTEIYWCRINCGKNVHARCFEKWNEFQKEQEKKCVYCLSVWKYIPKNTRFQSKLKRNRVGSVDT